MHIFIFLHFLFWLVEEKESKLTQLLNRQGITHYKYILSWFLTYQMLTFIPLVLISVFLSLNFFRHYFLLFLCSFLYDLAIFSTALFYHTFIDQVKIAATIMKVLTVCLTAFAYVIIQEGIPLYVKLVFSIFPQVSLLLNFQLLQMIDNYQTLDWKLWTTPYYNYSLFIAFVSDVVVIGIYFGLSLVIMKYKQSGLDCLSFIKSLFIKVERKVEDNIGDIDNIIKNHQEVSSLNQQKKNDNDYLSIRNVTRMYGQLKAVNNLSGEIYGGEIFCLLGHNGAGKTTLINMISGNEDLDTGDIFLGDTSLVTNKDYLYKNIGLCSQEDIFFDCLTVKEHLQLMSELKGRKTDNMLEIFDLMSRIDLTEKQNALCSTLSGGQKRKLCVALALIGNSKLILLDEPSSGMDPVAKRQLWRFLKGYKRTR